MKNFHEWSNINESIDVETIKDEIEDVEGVDAVEKILKSHNISFRKNNINGKDYIGLSLSGENYVIFDLDYVPEISELNNFIYSNEAQEMYADDTFNEDFWHQPTILYHATKEENWKMIQKDEEISKKCETRGITNRSVSCAVFTTEKINELLSGTYGNVILEIDTILMKRDGYTPTVSREPDIEEEIQLNNLINRLGFHESVSISDSSISPNTVIIHDVVPLKYIKVAKK